MTHNSINGKSFLKMKRTDPRYIVCILADGVRGLKILNSVSMFVDESRYWGEDTVEFEIDSIIDKRGVTRLFTDLMKNDFLKIDIEGKFIQVDTYLPIVNIVLWALMLGVTIAACL